MNKSILIVENEALIALDLKDRLEEVGYTVCPIVDNAVDALRVVETCRPSLVLMDIRLSGPDDGIETADRIRRRFHLPVMFVTAHADVHTLERAKSAKPFGYIVKPFHGIDFRARIETALSKHMAEQKLQSSKAGSRRRSQPWPDALIATGREETSVS